MGGETMGGGERRNGGKGMKRLKRGEQNMRDERRDEIK